MKIILFSIIACAIGYAICGMLNSLQAPAYPQAVYQTNYNHMVICDLGAGQGEGEFLNFCPPGDMPLPTTPIN